MPLMLSILVPLYNEEEFIGTILQRALTAPLPEGLDREIIVVDDGSTDGSAEIAEEVGRLMGRESASSVTAGIGAKERPFGPRWNRLAASSA